MAWTHKMLARKANREDPDQTASLEAVWSGSALFVYFWSRQLLFEILEQLNQDQLASTCFQHTTLTIKLCLLVVFANNFCKKLRPIKIGPDLSGSKLFDTDMILLKEYLKTQIFKNIKMSFKIQ